MTREQMIEELVEYEFQQITLVEVIQTFIKLRRELIDTTFSSHIIIYGHGRKNGFQKHNSR